MVAAAVAFLHRDAAARPPSKGVVFLIWCGWRSDIRYICFGDLSIRLLLLLETVNCDRNDCMVCIYGSAARTFGPTYLRVLRMGDV